MDKLNQQIVDGVYLILVSKPVWFIFAHSVMVGIVSGVISLIPFKVKRVFHIVILVIVVFSAYVAMDRYKLEFSELFYSGHVYFIAELVGNYIVGCLIGFAIANGIQRIRGEHNYVG